MPEITESTATDTITVAGEKFTVPQPYAEGHVLTAGEASALNQTFAENLRNNFAAKVKEAKEAGTFDLEVMQASFADRAAEYEFGQRRTGTGSARITDPVEAEAMNIARQKLREAIKKNGKSLKDYTTASITEGAKNLLAKYPEIRATAQKIVDARALETSGGELEVDVSSLEEAPEPAPETAPEAATATSSRKSRANAEVPVA